MLLSTIYLSFFFFFFKQLHTFAFCHKNDHQLFLLDTDNKVERSFLSYFDDSDFWRKKSKCFIKDSLFRPRKPGISYLYNLISLQLQNFISSHFYISCWKKDRWWKFCKRWNLLYTTNVQWFEKFWISATCCFYKFLKTTFEKKFASNTMTFLPFYSSFIWTAVGTFHSIEFTNRKITSFWLRLE